jgi:YegS/Rv2252/BmrU family lipid kinase
MLTISRKTPFRFPRNPTMTDKGDYGMKHLFILNPYAGTKDSTAELAAQIKAAGSDDVVIEYTACAGDAENIARRYAEQGEPLRVYACGGDGTANEALHGVIGCDNVALGVIPIGTGNDYVRSFPAAREDFLEIKKMMNGTTQRVDLLRCNERYALNVISAGYDCEVAEQAQRNKRLPLMSGPFAYKLAIGQCLITKRKHTFIPFADGVKVELPAAYPTQMLAVAAKGKYYGGGIKATPLAELGDGMIDFMSIPTVPLRIFAAMIGTFTKGEHIDNPKAPFIIHRKCTTLKFDNGGPLKIGIDGEMFVMENPVITVVPKAIDIIVPR